MKKTILKLSAIILMTVLMLLIPNSVNAETNYEFDYSQIKALDGQTPKYYEIDAEDGTIESQIWYRISDNMYDSNSQFMGPNETFEVGKSYRYVAKIKLTEKYDFAEVANLLMINGASSTVSIEEEHISIEIIAVVPKKFSVTVNMSEGILNSKTSYDVYEMDELSFDIELAEGYEVESITANGNHILGGSSYFEDTFAEMINNKVRVWSTNTNVTIEIAARPIVEVDPEKVNITMNEVKVGDKLTDLEFYVEDEIFEVTNIEIGTLEEIDNELEYTPAEGTFEKGKKYGVILHLKSNVGEFYEGEVEFYMGDETLHFEAESSTEYVIGIILPELEEKTTTENNTTENNDTENNTTENNNNVTNNIEKDDKNEKDDTPKTGDNILIIVKMLVLLSLGGLIITKK